MWWSDPKNLKNGPEISRILLKSIKIKIKRAELKSNAEEKVKKSYFQILFENHRNVHA